ncbi:MAG: hypothetical protein R3240_06115, partial [Gammaproteobacteria bacterium]|nr:hypothetical protein [Gammaproteobacteria bacterium]
TTLLTLMITPLVLLSGCTKYYLVESKYQMSSDRGAQAASVSRAKNFEIYKTEIKTLAVQAPDMCASESHAVATGSSSYRARRFRGAASNDIIKTICGVEMASIEKALTDAGYNVISWKVLQNKMANQETGKLVGININAAKQLGANAVFQINSLELGSGIQGSDARWDRLYYKSSIKGIKKDSTAVKTRIARQLDKLSEQNEIKLEQENSALSATINASVTFVDNAQVIWFYYWENKEIGDDGKALEAETIAKCNKKFCRSFEPEKEEGPEFMEEGSSRAISTGANSKDRYRYVQNKLMKAAIKDMVANFTR